MFAQFGNAAATDEHLAALVCARNGAPNSLHSAQGAYTELYLRHAPRLAAFLSRHVPPGELDDVKQAIWSRVWQKLPSLSGGGDFRAWLFTVARNRLIDRSRKRQHCYSQDMQAVPDLWSSPPDEQLAEEERMAQLRRCVNGLDPESRAVISGRLAGKTYAEICSLTGLPALKAHKLFYRAKRKVARCVNSAM